MNRDEFTLLSPGKFWEGFLASVMSEMSLQGTVSYWAEKITSAQYVEA